MILVLRPTTHNAIVAAAQPPFLTLLHRHLEPFPLPQPPDSLAIHRPSFPSQQGPDPSMAITGMQPHQLVHRLDQLCFILRDLEFSPLRASRLADHPARPALAHLELLKLSRHLPPSCRAYKFPSASSFSRLASEPFIPPYSCQR